MYVIVSQTMNIFSTILLLGMLKKSHIIRNNKDYK